MEQEQHDWVQRNEENNTAIEPVIEDTPHFSKRLLIGVLSGILLAVCFFFCCSPVKVHGQSMEHSLSDGDIIYGRRILVNPTYGDIVVFETDYEFNAIKRVIGCPGDEITMQGGKVYRNGVALTEPYAVGNTYPEESNPASTVVLKEDEYFCLGDNREHSSDSRLFGPIHKDAIKILLWRSYVD